MVMIKTMYVYLCFHGVLCDFDDISDSEGSDYDSRRDSSENKVISKEREYDNHEIKQENRNLNSTIETSVCKYQEINKLEEADEYEHALIDYPYAASIQRQGSHYASGALVDKRWVLSSAAEFHNVRESIKLFRVRLGSVDCKRGGTVFPIISVHIHPAFVRGEPSFDLALLRLAIPLTMTMVIRPISMSMAVGTVARATFMTMYWPRIVVKQEVLPSSANERIKFTNMRVSTQKLISSTTCSKMVGKLKDSSLCLKPIMMYHSVCTPDAGAPIVVQDKLWGITSGWVFPECASKPSPTVVTRVSTPRIRLWIESQLHS